MFLTSMLDQQYGIHYTVFARLYHQIIAKSPTLGYIYDTFRCEITLQDHPRSSMAQTESP